MNEDKLTPVNEEKLKTERKGPKGSVAIVEDRCKGCTYCISFCPTNSLEMGDKLNVKGYRLPVLARPDTCTGCDLCGTYCPEFAIRGFRIDKKEES